MTTIQWFPYEQYPLLYSATGKHLPAAFYTFPVGGHGWGFNESFPYHEDVKTLTLRWLKFIKVL